MTGTISADPDGSGPLSHRAVRNSYDSAGLLVRVERGTLAAWQNESIAPANWSGFTAYQVLDTQYDAMGRKTRDTLSNGPAGAGAVQSLTQYSHDGFGRLECTAVRLNLAAAPPPSACQLGTEGVHGPDRISRSVYNLAGEVTQLQVAVGTAAQANEASFTYTLNGQRASVTDGEGNRAELRYDGHGRQNRWVFPSPTTAGAMNEGDYEAYGYVTARADRGMLAETHFRRHSSLAHLPPDAGKPSIAAIARRLFLSPLVSSTRARRAHLSKAAGHVICHCSGSLRGRECHRCSAHNPTS